MRISATIGYLTRLTISGVAGVYMVAYGFPAVIVTVIAVIGLDLLGMSLLGQHKIVTLVVFVFAAMVALHYGWTVPFPYYTIR
jgi:hypothetical protein